MKKFGFILLSLILSGLTLAQNEVDALRYSFIMHGGSARYQAMGGALGGLGADFSVTATNPGALGRFSKHKISLSVDNNITSTKSEYNNNSTRDIGNKFTLSHLSAIFAKDIANKRNKWQYVQFGLGYNRTTNFATEFTYSGKNNTSLINVFANAGAGIQPADLLSYRAYSTNLAFESYAVDYSNITGQYTPRFNDSEMQHHGVMKRNGGITEYSFGLSANYANKFYIGASLNAHHINYTENLTYTETVLDTTGGSLREMEYSNSLSAKGTGINLKIGIVYLPFDWLRIGASFHTPTRTHLTEEFSSNMSTSQFLNGKDTTFNIHKDYIPSGKNRYFVTSPLKGAFSIGVVLQGRIALGAEVEIVNYSWAKLRTTTDTENYGVSDFTLANSEIRNQYGTGFNLRLGAEYLVNNNWSLRVGGGLYTSPYKIKGENRTPTAFGSAGFGYKIGIFAIDLSYMGVYQKESYYPFDPSLESNLVSIKKFNSSINLGISFTL